MGLDAYLFDRQYEEVDGWLLDGAAWVTYALATAQSSQGITGDIAEIGVHRGKYCILLSLLGTAGEKTVAIDVFGDQELNVDGSGEGDYDSFLANYQKFDPRPSRLIVHQIDSLQLRGRDLLAAGAPRKESVSRTFRIFSVDGSHTARHTRNDIEVAFDVLRDGGVVVVDDFYNPHWPGVQEGVHRLLAERRDISAVAFGENKLFLVREGDYARYFDAFANDMAELFSSRKFTEIHGRPCVWFSVRDPRQDIGRGLHRIEWRFGSTSRDLLSMSEGWTDRESRGCWINAETAEVELFLPPSYFQSEARPQNLSIAVYPFVHMSRPRRRVTIGTNYGAIHAAEMTGGNVVQVRFPPDWSQESFKLRFDAELPETPAEMIGSDDGRHLSLFVSKVTLN